MSQKGPVSPSYWYGEGQPPLPMRGLSWLYAAVVGVRRWLYRRGWRRRVQVAVPVIVVGNITAGGAGKTPLVIELVQRLRAEGWKPGVASRGYGRQDGGTPRWVQADTTPDLGGDEPVLIAHKTGAPVRVDRDRVAAARALVGKGCDIVVSDDGLQHYRLARDIEIEVIDANRRYGNGRMLPAGPLREPASRSEECDFRVVNLGQGGESGTAQAGSGFGEWQMRLRIDSAVPMVGGRTRALSTFAGQRVHAVAGIAHPQRFFAMLRELGIAVVPHAFPDHHHYRPQDLELGSQLPVLMTEKDAVKCAAFANAWCYSVPLQAELPAAFWVALLDRLDKLAPRRSAG